MILAYCNQKGGVGKSTTVYHHARAAILAGQRVLVIDADPQGNITSVLTEDMQEGDVGVADALSSRSDDTLAEIATLFASSPSPAMATTPLASPHP